ncbi:hypothetical protein V8F06_006327 [Rhypophila decipiens]
MRLPKSPQRFPRFWFLLLFVFFFRLCLLPSIYPCGGLFPINCEPSDFRKFGEAYRVLIIGGRISFVSPACSAYFYFMVGHSALLLALFFFICHQCHMIPTGEALARPGSRWTGTCKVPFEEGRRLGRVLWD